MQSSYTTTQLDRRADRIMRSIRVGAVSPHSDAIRELVEITEVLAEKPVKPVVVARMTVCREDGTKLIVEVHENSSFSQFYHVYTQTGNRRSTKRLLHSTWRNEGLMSITQVRTMKPGLELLAEKWRQRPGVTAVTVRILKRRAYRRLLHASPDQLGLAKMAPFVLPSARYISTSR